MATSAVAAAGRGRFRTLLFTSAAPLQAATRRAFADYKPNTQNYDAGAKAHGGFAGSFRPSVAEMPGLKSKMDSVTNHSLHNTALANIAKQVSIKSPEDALNAFKDRRARLSEQKAFRQQADIFAEAMAFLREPERWTFGTMAAYQRKVLHLMGATGWRRRMSGDDPSVLHLEKELRVLDAMTPVELASNHKKVFTAEATKLIAERSGTTDKFVNQVIMEHDILRADRKWYAIRSQFRQPLPVSFEDRQYMAEYDRPFSESERDMRDEMMDKEKLKQDARHVSPKRVHNVYYRQPTMGGNRWSTRAPRWFPAQFKMRPERRSRLAASSGGGAGRTGGMMKHNAGTNQAWGRMAGVPKGGRSR